MKIKLKVKWIPTLPAGPGDTVDIDDELAKSAIERGIAEAVTAEKPKVAEEVKKVADTPKTARKKTRR